MLQIDYKGYKGRSAKYFLSRLLSRCDKLLHDDPLGGSPVSNLHHVIILSEYHGPFSRLSGLGSTFCNSSGAYDVFRCCRLAGRCTSRLSEASDFAGTNLIKGELTRAIWPTATKLSFTSQFQL